MKIVYIGTCYPMRGGLAQFNAILARELSRRHQVTFLSFKRQYPGLFFPGKSQYVAEREAAAVVRFDAEPVLDSINPWSWWRTARRAVREKPDLVLYKYWMPFLAPSFGTVSRFIKRWSAARVLFVCDNIIPHERTPIDLALTRYAISAVDLFVTMSASVRDDLLRIKPDARWKLVQHPIYKIFGQRLEKGAARRLLGMDAGPWILFFGYIRKYKGLDLLLQALAQVRQRRPVGLVVAGEFYEGEARYRRMVVELGLEKAVRFHDSYIPEDRVGAYFSACDVVVLPYHTATQSGIVQVAYQVDAPVICTDVGGLAEVVVDGQTGFVVPPENPQALAESILRFYEEDCEERFRSAVRQEKKKYSWEPLVGAIEELAGQGRPPEE